MYQNIHNPSMVLSCSNLTVGLLTDLFTYLLGEICDHWQQLCQDDIRLTNRLHLG